MYTVQFLLVSFFAVIALVASAKFTSKDVKCHVCKATVLEMEKAVSKVDPKKKADVSGFRIDGDGNSIGKKVSLVKSEAYLTELMEEICGKMDDYVKVTNKKTGKFSLMKMIVDGKMNPESSEVDFVQDGDLNKTVGHLCLEVLEEQEEAFLKAFQKETLDSDLDIRICSEAAKLCDDGSIQEDYELESDDEYKEEL